MNNSIMSKSQELSVRIVKVDYYLAKPVAELKDVCYSGFRSLPVYQVPLIRIFGSTTAGIKTCVHIHGVFPYLFIPNWKNEILKSEFYSFASCLDKAINTSFANSSSKTAHVYRISVVSRKPFYGYYEDEKEFLKIEFYNPGIIKRAADLLLNGAVFNNNFQPYEAHVPYILQFFIDNNLYGMSCVTFSSYQKRLEYPSDENAGNNRENFKQTYCALEIDTSVDSIINDSSCANITEDIPDNPGLAFIWEEERRRRRLQGRRSQITQNNSQVRPECLPFGIELVYKQKLATKISRYKESFNSNPADMKEEEEANSSYEELNTQGRSILLMLEEMTKERESSPPSSPIVFSEDEHEDADRPAASSVALLSSQPFLKVSGENNSILGNDFSDDEVDEEDHLILSQSMYAPTGNGLAPVNDCENENAGTISQLDGADGEDTLTSKLQRKVKSKHERRAKSTYNLRSRNKREADSNESGKCACSKSDSKPSPRKCYPQLQIDTQKSPKSVRRASNSESWLPAAEVLCPSGEAYSSAFIAAQLSSPSSSIHSESRKSETKRPYPQLGVSISKSPRYASDPDLDDDIKHHRSNILKRRKIDFDENSSETNPDWTLTSLRWKKQQKEKNKKEPQLNCDLSMVVSNVVNELKKQPTNEITEENLPLPQTINSISGGGRASQGTNSPNKRFTISNEFGSQKYSLKIRLDTCGDIDEQKVWHNLLTKTPVVVVHKMNESDINKHNQNSQEQSENHSQQQQSAESKRSSSEVSFFLAADGGDTVGTPCSSESVSFASKEDADKAICSKSSCSSEDSSRTKKGSSPSSGEGSDSFPSTNVRLPSPPKIEQDIRNECKYSSVDDNEFPFRTVRLAEFSQNAEADSSKKELVEEAVPYSSSLEIPPLMMDDENFAPVNCSYSLGVEENAFLSNPYDFKKQDKNLDGLAALYSSINDDEFPEPNSPVNSNKSELANKPEVETECPASDLVVFSQSSDEAFAEFSFTQGSLRLAARVATDGSKFNSIKEEVAEDGNRLEPSVEKNLPETPGAKIPACAFDNSIWDSVDNATDDDDQIRSFYSDESVSSINDTLFPEDKIDEENPSSPGVEQLTPDSEDEIRSVELEKARCGRMLSRVTSAKPSSPILMRRCSDEWSTNDVSPSNLKQHAPHSTPQSTRKKKSPSPMYTPILKQLMLKKMAGEERRSRSRVLLQSFQTETPLDNVKEEEEFEVQPIVENTSKNMLANDSDDKQKAESSRSHCSNGSGQIDMTMANTFGFRMSLENLQNVKADVQHQYITVLSVELFVPTRHDLNPDPEFDPVCCIFYSLFNDDPTCLKIQSDSNSYQLDLTRFHCEKSFVKDENELFDKLITFIRKWDPDIFIGYEVEMLSWGYLIQRAHFLGRNYDTELSRLVETKTTLLKDKTTVEEDEYSNDLKLAGRIVLNVWRLMRHEIALQSYTFENMLFHVLHQRVPLHSFRVLTEWWKNSLRKWIVVDYFLLRAEGNILLLQQLDFIGRTSELARLFGIQFYEVLSRGSQFRVESMMLRLAKKWNFLAVSPSTKQRAAMRAPASLPLIMEPESKLYTDPVIVLDFQSLYPSIIIAYNYCFSTCLGRVEYLAAKETFNLGCIQHTVPTDVIKKLESSLNISPCGVAFVNKDVRLGVLPTMLQEILETRLVVKKSMKENKGDNTLQRVLHARQLGLKLIANVTYGYTSANFSGRMPCIEVGDSVVSKGRETLERVVKMVTDNEKWAAKVVYGDTDSIFVRVPNRTKEEAFRIGAEIVDAVSKENPKPVKLKLEKVYYPCILQTKKRYVGYMYESPDQKEPIYDAKGIETVRRDGCPAISKILEKSLKLLFDQKGVEGVHTVKQYVQRQFSKLVAGRLSIQELTFAREYRGIKNYKPAACVPALQLAKKALLRDRRAEPRVKERVRYLLCAGPPGVPLIKSIRTPEEFLNNPGTIVNAEYYITRAIIPALERCFSLLGVDVRSWYSELPRKQKLHLPLGNDLKNKAYKKKTISHYFTSSKCIACEEISVTGVCKECHRNPQKLALHLGYMINQLQRKFNYIEKICRSCCNKNDIVECSSLDCPVYYNYRQAARDIEQVPYLQELQQTFLPR